MGSILDLENPELIPTTAMHANDQQTIYLAEIYDLALTCSKLYILPFEVIFTEYRTIIQKKSLRHQFISNLIVNNRILGCIDPAYRKCKRLKIGFVNRQILLVLCDFTTKNNVEVLSMYQAQPVKIQCLHNSRSSTVCLRYNSFNIMVGCNILNKLFLILTFKKLMLGSKLHAIDQNA